MIIAALRRFFTTLPVLFGVATVTFLLIHFVPGDPVDAMLGENASAQDKSALRHEMGLDEPLDTQYANFWRGLIHADLGRSLISQRKVSDEILERLPATVELTLAATLISLLLGIPLGILSAIRHNRLLDRFILGFSLLGISIPGFWLAPMLIMFFSIQLEWLPVSERGGFDHLILPAVSLGFALASILIRMTRASMLDVLKEDYIRVARSKGMSNARVYVKHGLKNALMPIITIVGLQFGSLLTGAVVTETIFDWPGVGTLFFQSIQQRNYPLVQGCVLLIAVTYVTVTFLTDISYLLVNPKLRSQ